MNFCKPKYVAMDFSGLYHRLQSRYRTHPHYGAWLHSLKGLGLLINLLNVYLDRDFLVDNEGLLINIDKNMDSFLMMPANGFYLSTAEIETWIDLYVETREWLAERYLLFIREFNIVYGYLCVLEEITPAESFVFSLEDYQETDYLLEENIYWERR